MVWCQVSLLELARIGWQRFALELATCDQIAALPSFDIFATRLSAQPLREETRKGGAACPPKKRTRPSSGVTLRRSLIKATSRLPTRSSTATSPDGSTLDELWLFVEEYEAARGYPLSGEEKNATAAVALYVMA